MLFTTTFLAGLSLAFALPQASECQEGELPKVTDRSYQGVILGHTNAHRFNHSATDVTWNTTLAGWAKTQAEGCVYQQSRDFGDGNYGQNIGAGFNTSQMGDFVTDFCYNNEENAYPFGTEPNQDTLKDWGHFSQMVWKASESVGCYTFDCSSKGGLQNVPSTGPGMTMSQFYTVCNFYPAGNVIDNYVKNVGDPLGYEVIDGDY